MWVFGGHLGSGPLPETGVDGEAREFYALYPEYCCMYIEGLEAKLQLISSTNQFLCTKGESEQVCLGQWSSRAASRVDPHLTRAPNDGPRIVIQRTVAPKSRSLLDLWDPSRQSPPGSSPQPRLPPRHSPLHRVFFDRNPLLRTNWRLGRHPHQATWRNRSSPDRS